MSRKLTATELTGGVFIACCAWLTRRLHAWNGNGLLGILFGAVNGSAWESAKTLLLPFLLWAVLEVLALGLPLRRFAVAKTAALYWLGALYLLLRTAGVGDLPSAAAAWATALLLFGALYASPLPVEWLFAPAVVLLFLFTALYFSLTPFPPRTALFTDPATGMTGIIPPHYDYGAAALDALYSA